MTSINTACKGYLRELPKGHTVIDVPNGTVVLSYTADVVKNDRGQLKLYVQLIDDYGYQRELTVEYVQNSDPLKTLWRYHAYRHPGRRNISLASPEVAIHFIRKFFGQTKRYPSLLFNEQRIVDGKCERPTGAGFVHLNEQLLDGASLSVNLL